MVGMAKLVGTTSVFIKRPGWNDPMIYSLGDQVSGFRIVAIESGHTIFERDGVQLWLAIGGEDRASKQPELAGVSEGGAAKSSGGDVARVASANHKRRDPSIKTGGTQSTTVMADADGNIDRKAAGGVKTRYVAASRQSGGFISPIDGKVTSGFGYRKHPMGGGRRYHRGIDIPAKTGTPIRSAGSGRVVEAQRDWAKGLYMVIDHGNGFTTHYFHMSKQIAKVGQWIKQGEVIGAVGTTGMSTGPHLHMELHKNGQPVDPQVHIRELADR